MSNLSDAVVVNVTDLTQGVQTAGFDTALLLSVNAGVSPRTAWTSRIKTYANLDAVGVDFLTTDPEYKAAQSYFGQSPAPSSLMIGRRTLLPTQVWNVSVKTVANSTAYALITGAYNTTTSITSDTSATNEEIVDALVAALNTAGPTQSTITHGGTPGSTTYGYKILAKGVGAFDTLLGAEKTTGTGATTLSETDTNILTWANTTGNAGYDIYRTTGGATQGLIGSVAANVITFTDTGIAATGSAPSVRFLAAKSGSGSSAIVTITSQAAGNWCPVKVVDAALLSVAMVHADPGVATDLAAINLESPAWYGLLAGGFNSFIAGGGGESPAISAWAEANGKMFVQATNESKVENDALSGATDIAAYGKSTAWRRTLTLFTRTPASFGDAGWCGVMFPKDPWSSIWVGKTIAGLPADTLSGTQQGNVADKYATFYYAYGGKNVTAYNTAGATKPMGRTCSGSFADTVIGIDKLSARIQEGIATLMVTKDKIPLTDEGINLVKGELKRVLQSAVDGQFLVPDSITITLPKRSAMAPADVASRTLRGSWTAQGAGALQGCILTGAVTL